MFRSARAGAGTVGKAVSWDRGCGWGWGQCPEWQAGEMRCGGGLRRQRGESCMETARQVKRIERRV